MLNRPVAPLSEPASGRTSVGLWDVDRRPTARLVWLFAGILGCFLVVAARLAFLQLVARDRFTSEPEHLTRVLEPLPSSNGRILSADGTVLAQDVRHFTVLAHYRWLEQPPDRDWLRHQALSRLPASDRRNWQRVHQEEQRVLAAREAMWSRLASLLRVSPEQLQQKRQAIQRRVERIVERVERRRAARWQEQLRRRRSFPADPNLWLHAPSQAARQAWGAFVDALTTPPPRRRHDPVVVVEELSYHVVADDVPFEVAAEIESHPELFPGLRCRVSYQRVYPQHDLAAHVVGSRVPAGAADGELSPAGRSVGSEDPYGYAASELVGRTGVERSCELWLRGVSGVRQLTKNARGEVVGVRTLRPPRAGCDVELTLHVPLQREAERILDQAVTEVNGGAGPGGSRADARHAGGGCLVVLDVHTGEILAAACSPRFDLNLLVHPDPAQWARLAADPRSPFLPRLTHLQLPPGSVFKTLTAVAALESGRVDPTRPIFCRGYLDRPDRYRCLIYRRYGYGHGRVDLVDALRRSCNVYFFTAARTMGPEPLVLWAQRFGFGRPTGVDLPNEKSGHLPVPPRLRRHRDAELAQVAYNPFAEPLQSARADRVERWYPGDTLGLAIGQASLTVTPLQIVRMMAAVANGGYLVTPHVVRRVFGVRQQPHATVAQLDTTDSPAGPTDNATTSGVRVVERNLEPVPIPGLRPSTLKLVRQGLEQVVASPRGTGHRTVYLKDIPIAGKTGTAEAGSARDHAWFAGYVPADQPQYAFVVVLEHGGSGGHAAGPVARKLVQAMLRLGLLKARSR